MISEYINYCKLNSTSEYLSHIQRVVILFHQCFVPFYLNKAQKAPLEI
jgi:hypothetical protein